jgi:hypothetical protein
MPIQPTLAHVPPSCGAAQAAGSFNSGLALPRRLWSRIHKQLPSGSFVFAAWSSCCGACRSAASESAVVPSAMAGLRSTNAWLARPHPVRPRHNVGPASLRAFHRILSFLAACAYFTDHALPARSDAALLIEIGAHRGFFRTFDEDGPSPVRDSRVSPAKRVCLPLHRSWIIESAGEPHAEIAITANIDKKINKFISKITIDI